MLTLTEEECITLINQGQSFDATINDGAFRVKIEEYSPVICTAIHNGHNLRSELSKVSLLTEQERRFEEAPFTGELISSFPIQIICSDSRFEYDLNRPKTLSTYFKTAWDKKVWSKQLSTQQRNKSHKKHESFYQVLNAIVAKVEELFDNAILFDVYAYNYRKFEKECPTFNIGTAQIDIERWGNVVKRCEKELEKIKLPNLDVTAARNEIFEGRGYLISHVNAHFDNTVVMPIEVQKVFMDENTGQVFPLVLEELKKGMKQAFAETTAFFVRRFGKKKKVKSADIFSSTIDPHMLAVDKQLSELCRGFETLNFINPANIATQKNQFFKHNGQIAPEFKYKQLHIDPYKFREHLYKLPVSTIMDADVQRLYRHIIDDLANKVDLLTTVGTKDFVYASLKYYGEPTATDVANANFIMHAPKIKSEHTGPVFDGQHAVEHFRYHADKLGIACGVELSNKLVAKAMVNNKKCMLLVNKNASFTQAELDAYVFHELGVHMATTLNGRKQPLRIMSIGLPDATHSQEGLAIYSEYCTGNLTLSRLKTLAMRVLVVKHMLDHNDFVKTYHYMVNEHDVEQSYAFDLTARAYRGGGFTKDYLYLKGLRDVIVHQRTANITDLLAGKVGLSSLGVISELIHRGILQKPAPMFPLTPPKQSNGIIDYIVSGIK